jgi:hypothetical protein
MSLHLTAGIPACHWYGEHDDFNCIVIDLLGPSLKLLRQAVSDFTLDAALKIACQLVSTNGHITQFFCPILC